MSFKYSTLKTVDNARSPTYEKLVLTEVNNNVVNIRVWRTNVRGAGNKPNRDITMRVPQCLPAVTMSYRE